MIREICENDLDGLLHLYLHLHEKTVPAMGERLAALWQRILSDSDHHIIVAEEDGKIVSSCVCVIVPNLTHELRPYAVVENVVTDAAYRGRGLATACLNHAKAIAEREGCYKLMLMTGAKDRETLEFYEHAGYNRHDKTGFIQWLGG